MRRNVHMYPSKVSAGPSCGCPAKSCPGRRCPTVLPDDPETEQVPAAPEPDVESVEDGAEAE